MAKKLTQSSKWVTNFARFRAYDVDWGSSWPRVGPDENGFDCLNARLSLSWPLKRKARRAVAPGAWVSKYRSGDITSVYPLLVDRQVVVLRRQ